MRRVSGPRRSEGKMFYFGKWDDPVSAEQKWERDKIALLEGRKPDDLTVGDSVGWICNVFMDSKSLQHQRGELSKRATRRLPPNGQTPSPRISGKVGALIRCDRRTSNDTDRHSHRHGDRPRPTITCDCAESCSSTPTTSKRSIVRFHIGSD